MKLLVGYASDKLFPVNPPFPSIVFTPDTEVVFNGIQNIQPLFSHWLGASPPIHIAHTIMNLMY